MLGAVGFQSWDIGGKFIFKGNGSTWWPLAYDPNVPKMSVWRCRMARRIHPRHKAAMFGARDSPGTLLELAIRATPLSFLLARMPVRFPRTMDDVDDAEEAELRPAVSGRRRCWGDCSLYTSSPTFGASASRLDALLPHPPATIDHAID